VQGSTQATAAGGLRVLCEAMIAPRSCTQLY
jgi:hypothetical protein